MERYLLQIFSLLFFTIACGQMTMAQDATIELQPVTIQGLPFEKFAPGNKIQKSDTIRNTALNQGTLADYLIQKTPIYIREYGHGMLASISFRGTGANHTSVMWNGINLNSLTLGQSDFSLYPNFLFDEIVVQYGGASALHGSDAIGGAIHLDNQPKWNQDRLKIGLQQDVGSFGNVFTGVKLQVSKENVENITKIYRRKLENDFTYEITDRLGANYTITQENAAVDRYGFLQELYIKINRRNLLSVKGWYNFNDRENQPLMVSTPEEEQVGDKTRDQSLRLLVDHQLFTSGGYLQSSVAFISDKQLFDDHEAIDIRRLIANSAYELDLGEKSLLKLGGQLQFIHPTVHAYHEVANEIRGDMFLSYTANLSDRTQLAANVRKSFVPFTKTPVAPSLSMVHGIRAKQTLFETRLQVERSFRVPTFNDRYWRDQGRLDLRPEDGYSFELGESIKTELLGNELELDLSAYYMIVDDWITWQETTFLSDRDGNGQVEQVTDWRPFNLKKVNAYGLEMGAAYHFPIGEIRNRVHFQYAFNRSILRSGSGDDDPNIGQQLPYTPIHRYTLGYHSSFQGWQLDVLSYLVGERHTTDINDVLESFNLVDLTVGKQIPLRHHAIGIQFTVKNVFDEVYQNLKRRAMPRRNYLFSIQYNLHKNLNQSSR